MGVKSFKDGKLITIIKEFEVIKGTNKYNINGVDLPKAIYFWRSPQGMFENIPLGSYTIEQSGVDTFLVITDKIELDKKERIQIGYEFASISSEYEVDFNVDINILKDNYNKAIEDIKMLFEYIKNNMMTADSLDVDVVLPQLDSGEVWVKTETGWRGLNVGSLEENIKLMLEEIKRIRDLLIEEMRAEKDKLVVEILGKFDEEVLIGKQEITTHTDEEIARINATGIDGKLDKENTIADLIASKKYKVGDVVQVLGYYSAGDGGGHPRQKKPTGYSGADAITGTDGSIWGIVHSGEVKASWFNSNLSAFNYCSKEKLVLKADRIELDSEVPLCNMNVKELYIGLNGKIVNPLIAQDVEINIGTLTTYGNKLIGFHIEDGFSKNIKVRIDKISNSLPSVKESLDRIFFIYKFDTVDFKVATTKNIDMLLLAHDCRKVILNDCVLEDFLTGFYIECEELYANNLSGECSTVFKTFVSGLATNGKDILLGGGKTTNFVSNIKTKNLIERSVYGQIDGQDNYISNVYDNVEFKCIGKTTLGKTARLTANNINVRNLGTGNSPLTLYDMHNARISNSDFFAPNTELYYELFTLDYLDLVNSSFYSPKAIIFNNERVGNLGITGVNIFNCDITSKALLQLDKCNVRDLTVTNSNMTFTDVRNFGIFNNVQSFSNAIVLENCNIKCGEVTYIDLANSSLTISNSTISAENINQFIGRDANNIQALKTPKTTLKSNKFNNVSCDFIAKFRETPISSLYMDEIFEEFSLKPIDGSLNINLNNYIVEAWNGDKYCKTSVYGGVVTDVSGSRSGLININVSGKYLGVPVGTNVKVYSLRASLVSIQNLDTPYHAFNMQKLGVLDSYHNYLTELHEYEKQQNTQSDTGVMNLNVIRPPAIPTKVEAYAKEYNVI